MDHMEEIISTIKTIKSEVTTDLQQLENQIAEIKTDMLKEFILARVQDSKLDGNQIHKFNSQLSDLYEQRNILNAALSKLDIQHEDPILKELVELIHEFQNDDFLFD
jgi:type II secretory pathway component PulF